MRYGGDYCTKMGGIIVTTRCSTIVKPAILNPEVRGSTIDIDPRCFKPSYFLRSTNKRAAFTCPRILTNYSSVIMLSIADCGFIDHFVNFRSLNFINLSYISILDDIAKIVICMFEMIFSKEHKV